MSMRTGSRLVFFFLLFTPWIAAENLELTNGTVVVFASREKGVEILTRRDDFVTRMSSFDRAARMKTDREVSQETFLAFVGENVLPWDKVSRQKVTHAFSGIRKMMKGMNLPFPEKVYIIKTTGKEEGGAAYTRSSAVILPEVELSFEVEKLQRTICHELFHVLSRANPELKERLYRLIGFEKCEEVTFPAALEKRKITNPDAPLNDHCIQLRFKGEKHWAIPILFSVRDKYDVDLGGEFFNYLVFQFLMVQRGEGMSIKPVQERGVPLMAGVREVSGFVQQVGRNTGYIIHPEEILADNFALLLTGEQDVPTPSLIRSIKKMLKEECGD